MSPDRRPPSRCQNGARSKPDAEYSDDDCETPYRRLPSLLIPHGCQGENGGARRDRTDDLKLAKLALSQLSYGPFWTPLVLVEETLVGPGRFELPTPRLSSVCSNQLSYGPSPVAIAVTGLAIPSPLSARVSRQAAERVKEEKRGRR